MLKSLKHLFKNSLLFTTKTNKKNTISYLLMASVSIFLAYQTWYKALSNELIISQTCLKNQQTQIITQLQRKKSLIYRYIKPLAKHQSSPIYSQLNTLFQQPLNQNSLITINNLTNQCISILKEQNINSFKKQNSQIEQSLIKNIHRYNAEIMLINQQIKPFPYSFIAKSLNIKAKKTLPCKSLNTLII